MTRSSCATALSTIMSAMVSRVRALSRVINEGRVGLGESGREYNRIYLVSRSSLPVAPGLIR
jgi:hypothetical protein